MKSTLLSEKTYTKSVCIVLLFTMFFSLIAINNSSYANLDTRAPYTNGCLSQFPQFDGMIQSLKANHPNWNFTILYTNLDWSSVIAAEESKNLSYTSGGWVRSSASEIAYYMDARNFLDENNIFQFEQNSFNPATHTVEGVRQMIAGTWLATTFTYTNTAGQIVPLSDSFENIIYSAAQDYGVSPYLLAARILQEQGRNSPEGWAYGGGYNGQNVGYYNLFNVEAYGSSTSQIINNGISYAMRKGLTSPEASIRRGAYLLNDNYIGSGQDTLYLEKFDVVGDGLYYNQYMENISAASSEGYSIMQNYRNMGMLDYSFNFIIPVYNNMGGTISSSTQATIVTQDVQCTGYDVNYRTNGSLNGATMGQLNPGDIVLRIEQGTTKSGGYIWDKIVLPDGQKAYMATNYLAEIEEQRNCNDPMVVNGDGVNLRNGPGLDGTTVITTLSNGQSLVRIERDKYNLNGYIWDRVMLADGTKGYIAQNYLTQTGASITTIVSGSNALGGELAVRSEPNGGAIYWLQPGESFTITQKDAANDGRHIWYRITLPNGMMGYTAAVDLSDNSFNISVSELYIVEQQPEAQPQPEPTPEPTPEPEPPTQIVNENIKGNETERTVIEGTELLTEPKTSVEALISQYGDVTVTTADGTQVSTGQIGTGYIVTIGGASYTAVKLGDTNGDADVTALDYVRIKNHIMNTTPLEGAYLSGADVNKNGSITALDYVRVKNQIMEYSNISLT